ncbi:hypothetical protein BD408DRAFT_410507 [Parasitella parasitica]|nr:hypothetical protein BD408DRAFT_410507 [Parasitella parasitica]
MTDSNKKEDNSVSSSAISSSMYKRPRLGYLRSAWTTSDLYFNSYSSTTTADSAEQPKSEEGEKDGFFNIKLPLIQLQDYEDEAEQEQEKDEIIREIFRMTTIANILCLSGSIVECGFVIYSVPSIDFVIQHYQDWMPYAILPFYTLWWLFMILVLKNRTEHLGQYLNWTRASAVVMASTNFMLPIQRYQLFQQFHTLFVALSILASFIFAFAKRILLANNSKSERLKSRLSREHVRLQEFVDQHTADFSNHRLAFLSTVSQEIHDVALMVITTLEQFSPAAILSNAHELLSACSLAVPIASISAINTTIRQVCHVSSHLQLLSKLTVKAWVRTSNANSLQLPDLILGELDIGELLQNIGDALAGVASKLDVNFVIYHCENSLHHTSVVGDEGAIRHALLNHLRNVLECCTPGACIEVGLNVANTNDAQQCKITFYITHTSSPAIRNASAALLPNANLTAQLLQYINADCAVDQDTDMNQTRFEISFDLARGSKKDIDNKMFFTKESYLLKSHYANVKFANEPSLRDLEQFIENLKGLKMVLHAPEQSIFAKHLTSCLASWNTDISHVPVANRNSAPTAAETATDASSSSPGSSAASTPLVAEAANDVLSTPVAPRQPSTPPVPSPAIEEEHIHSIPPAFILIDDDIGTLESKLAEFRSQPAASANVLQAHHGVRRAAHHHHPHHHYKKSTSTPQNFFHQGTTAIIHFTSLTKYKAVRDIIQCYALLPFRDPFSMPRVVVVPKPAGPRRFLTALHTAWHNSVVEPHFSAIATSPSSPMPPVISMLVQREIATAAAAAAPSEVNNRVSPNDISPGRRNGNRPLSGLFSPPPPHPPNGDNYFSSHPEQHQQQLSPHTTCSATAAPTSASASNASVNQKRRSANNTAQTSEQDYLNAKAAPLASALGVVSANSPVAAATIVAASIAAAELENESADKNGSSSGSSSNTLDTTSTESPNVMLPARNVPATSTLLGADAAGQLRSGVEITDSAGTTTATTTAAAAAVAVAVDTDEITKKKLSKTMSNFKLNKKKKKAKGTPFANSVSPPINVLIVEDNIINQAILSAWMKKHKIKFSVASNGKEAVDKWKSGGFHLILMDIQLPVMNGIEATKTIRSIEKEQQIGVLPMSSSFLRQQQQQQQQLQQEPIEVVAAAAIVAAAAVNEMKAEATPLTTSSATATTSKNDDKPSIFRSPVIIVALTASSLESDRHAALAAGCNDFLTKPVSLEWLEKKIIEWGCMQALIDFEGWRRWKRNTNADEKSKSIATATATIAGTLPVVNEQFEAEKKRIEELSKKKNVPGVLLPGVSNLIKPTRRSTTASNHRDKKNKPTLKPSKSDSDTQNRPRMKRNKSQSGTTTSSSLLNQSRSTSTEQKPDNDIL